MSVLLVVASVVPVCRLQHLVALVVRHAVVLLFTHLVAAIPPHHLEVVADVRQPTTHPRSLQGADDSGVVGYKMVVCMHHLKSRPPRFLVAVRKRIRRPANVPHEESRCGEDAQPPSRTVDRNKTRLHLVPRFPRHRLVVVALGVEARSHRAQEGRRVVLLVADDAVVPEHGPVLPERRRAHNRLGRNEKDAVGVDHDGLGQSGQQHGERLATPSFRPYHLRVDDPAQIKCFHSRCEILEELCVFGGEVSLVVVVQLDGHLGVEALSNGKDKDSCVVNETVTDARHEAYAFFLLWVVGAGEPAHDFTR
mmetsp:Transcript_46460/g.109358  ORF Transcript_46460/g.109358 Transcript_46460/m.109358 type:complete len:308 (-) Transcript_46460:523-1446(-)